MYFVQQHGESGLRGTVKVRLVQVRMEDPSEHALTISADVDVEVAGGPFVRGDALRVLRLWYVSIRAPAEIGAERPPHPQAVLEVFPEQASKVGGIVVEYFDAVCP